MSTATLVGTSGLVGSNLLSILSNHPNYVKTSAFVRKTTSPSTLPETVDFSKVDLIVEPDSGSWAKLILNLNPSTVFFSALGTTKALAGSIEAQRKIDYTLNHDLAQAAFDSKIKTYVLVSAVGAATDSWFAYSKMKGELERDVAVIGFDHTIILRPAMILGDRDKSQKPPRMAEKVAQSLVRGISSVSPQIGHHIANNAADIAAAGIHAALLCQTGKRSDGKTGGEWIIGPKDIHILAAQFHEAVNNNQTTGTAPSG